MNSLVTVTKNAHDNSQLSRAVCMRLCFIHPQLTQTSKNQKKLFPDSIECQESATAKIKNFG